MQKAKLILDGSITLTRIVDWDYAGDSSNHNAYLWRDTVLDGNISLAMIIDWNSAEDCSNANTYFFSRLVRKDTSKIASPCCGGVGRLGLTVLMHKNYIVEPWLIGFDGLLSTGKESQKERNTRRQYAPRQRMSHEYKSGRMSFSQVQLTVATGAFMMWKEPRGRVHEVAEATII